MHFFTAVVLVCQLSTTPPTACNETSALDVVSTHVASELGCTHGWQELISRGALKEEMDKGFYVKTLCRRNVQASNATVE